MYNRAAVQRPDTQTRPPGPGHRISSFRLSAASVLIEPRAAPVDLGAGRGRGDLHDGRSGADAGRRAARERTDRVDLRHVQRRHAPGGGDDPGSGVEGTLARRRSRPRAGRRRDRHHRIRPRDLRSGAFTSHRVHGAGCWGRRNTQVSDSSAKVRLRSKPLADL